MSARVDLNPNKVALAGCPQNLVNVVGKGKLFRHCRTLAPPEPPQDFIQQLSWIHNGSRRSGYVRRCFLGVVHESPRVRPTANTVRHSDGLGIMADEVGVFAQGFFLVLSENLKE
ncbi:unnamed protein product [Prunus brigantina]